MNKQLTLMGAILLAASMLPAWATDEPMTEMDHSTMDGMDHNKMKGMDNSKTQEMDHSKMEGMDNSKTQEMDHSKMEGMDHSKTEEMDHSKMKEMDHSKMEGMDHSKMGGSMQGGSAPADARDPHAFADGYDFGLKQQRLRLADEYNFGSLLVDRLETVRTSGNTSAVYDLQAWYGRDYDRLALKAEGDIEDGNLEEASTELLWSHAIASFWNTQLGVRYDSGEGPNRGWLAFGIQGLAPYWFEVDVTAYLGTEVRSALSMEAEYDILFTQKWILQPRIEAEINGKDDIERGIGAGLSELAVGLRLRYEFQREFAPYIGVEWASTYGNTADLARAAGLNTTETRAVAGVRFWF